MAIRIIGTGSYVPPKILTNEDLEKIVDTTDEWITTRTGIKERHIAELEMLTSDLALEAGRRAIEAAGITPDQLSFISVATATGDRLFPSTACYVQQKLGASPCPCYDLLAACSGLLYSMELGTSLLRGSKKYRYGLIIGAEKISSIINWEDRSTCVLFGDGASAIVVMRDDSVPDSEDCIAGAELTADGTYTSILQLPAGGCAMPASHETVDHHLHSIQMGGQEVFKLAVTSMVSSSKKVLDEAGVLPSQLAWVIPHQANLRIITAVASRLKVPSDRVYVNVSKYGNTSAASIGICLDEMARSGKLKKGDLILLTAFGAGLTWGSILLRW